jgi:hypothetical protein
MIVRLKDGVDLNNVHVKMFMAIGLISTLFEQFGCHELWITGAREHGHTTNPDVNRQFHWLPNDTCQAIDLRTHDITGNKYELQHLVARLLGPLYDVFLEFADSLNEHLHIQYDPERPGTA